ncbi:D-alanyl-D-alanine carboxypeptidase family protein [Sulfitobacter pontiacus]
MTVPSARTGEVLHSRNADTRLHPASLTKMMTLYIAFEAIKRGEISLDSKVKITSHAASEPPSKLGLKSGQTIALRYLIRAAAVKSANDAATAIGEAIEGSEAKFADMEAAASSIRKSAISPRCRAKTRKPNCSSLSTLQNRLKACRSTSCPVPACSTYEFHRSGPRFRSDHRHQGHP